MELSMIWVNAAPGNIAASRYEAHKNPAGTPGMAAPGLLHRVSMQVLTRSPRRTKNMVFMN
jgi:hypothetical protein